MEEFRLAGFTPDTLVELCMRRICDVCPPWPSSTTQPATPLPAELGDRLFQMFHERHNLTDAALVEFTDKNKIRLRSVNLPHNHQLSTTSILTLLDHKLSELQICNGSNLPSVFVFNSQYFANMTSLRVVKNKPMFHFPSFNGFSGELVPKLTKLILVGHMSLELCTLETLEQLELSDCEFYLEPTYQLKNLTSLTLYNVWWIEDNIRWICTLVNLRHLDISQHKEKFGHFNHPNEKLALMVSSLPLLKSLDISGTNLAGTGGATTYDDSAILCDIPGLSSRVDNPLNFLGLYGTAHSACCRHDIPALKISGDANEEQILTAATLYVGRPEILTKVLNDLFYLFRNERNDPEKQWETLNIILKGMDMHVSEKHIQICGSGLLFYIVKGKKNEMGIKLRRHIISTLLKALETHFEDLTMMRNGCLTLCQFKTPADILDKQSSIMSCSSLSHRGKGAYKWMILKGRKRVVHKTEVFEYNRVVKILLKGVSNNDDAYVQRVVIYLLNSFVCQVDAVKKKFFGDHGVIRIMLTLISDRLNRSYFDDVLEIAWSTMWNVTDETPINCQRFLDNKGMDLFIRCLKCFPGKEEMLRNMMGLLGNVAEVRHLRPIFMSENLIKEFVKLMDTQSDGIEVSYHAAGVIAHVASDGKNAWKIKNPSRKEVLGKMTEAISKWNINSKRNINYRSLAPLVGLLKAFHTPECQHWAIWALANLTTVYPEKYCCLVTAEKGIDFIRDILYSPLPYQEIKVLACNILKNCSAQTSTDVTKK